MFKKYFREQRVYPSSKVIFCADRAFNTLLFLEHHITLSIQCIIHLHLWESIIHISYILRSTWALIIRRMHVDKTLSKKGSGYVPTSKGETMLHLCTAFVSFCLKTKSNLLDLYLCLFWGRWTGTPVKEDLTRLTGWEIKCLATQLWIEYINQAWKVDVEKFCLWFIMKALLSHDLGGTGKWHFISCVSRTLKNNISAKWYYPSWKINNEKYL